jgi:hypothetical protein
MNNLTSQIQTAKIVTELKRAGVYKPEFNIVGLEGLAFKDGKFLLTGDESDRFNDSIIVISAKQNPVTKQKEDIIIDAYSATTEPGKYYTLNPMNAAGAARMAFGSYKNCYEFGTHGVKAPHPALTQCGNITVCRDLNQDFSRVGDRMYTGNHFAVNLHAAVGSPDFTESIGLYSAGCQCIRLYKQQKIFMKLCRQSGFKTFSYSLFDGAAVIPGSELPLKPKAGSIPD